MITIPSIQDLFTGIISAIESELNVTTNEDLKSDLRAEAAVQAGKLKQFYLAIGELQKNIWPDDSDEETLLRFGVVKLGRLPFSAVAAQYSIQVTGQIGALIPAGSIFKSDDTSLNPGILYRLDTQFIMTGTTDVITVRSLTQGLISKLNLSDTMTSTSPISLVNNQGIVISEVVQPLAAEPIDDYRQKVLDAFRLEAMGGAATDYRIWSADAQGVKTVYPYARNGFPCEINLFIEATLSDSIDGKGTPTTQIINDVESVVNFDPDTSLPFNQTGRRPLQVIVNYFPVTIREVKITITGYQGLDLTIQGQLLLAFTNAIALVRPFVAAADPLLSKNDIIDTNKLIGIIVTAKPGAIFSSVSFTIDNVIMSSFTFTAGDIPYLNPSITYN